MPFQSCPNIAEAVIQATLGGKPVVNVVNFLKPGGYDQTAIDDLAQGVDAAVGTNYLPIAHVGYVYVNTLVRGLENIIDLSGSNNDSAGSGSGGVNALPNNVSFCVTLRTGKTGRSARGRFYVAGVDDTALATPNTVNTTYSAAAVDLLDAIIAQGLAVGWIAVILSRRSLGAPRPVGIGTAITSAEARNVILDSQRGRLPQGH